MIFDTHTHLNVSAFEGEEKEVIARAKELAVTRFAVVGDSIRTRLHVAWSLARSSKKWFRLSDGIQPRLTSTQY